MIPLPDSLRLKRSTADERKLLAASRAWLEKDERKQGLHASDFLDLRQAFWKAVDPQPSSDRQIPIFLVGKILHGFVLGAMDGANVDLNVTDEGSSWNEEIGFWYSPDWDKGEIAEFKSSRAFKEPRDATDIDNYIEQVLIYMVAKQRTSAKLWVLYLNLKDKQRRTSPEFRAYSITVSPEDLTKLGDYLRTAKQQLTDAISHYGAGDRESYRALPLCRDFKCGAGRCEWWDKCQPEGRYGEPRWGTTAAESDESAEVSKPSRVLRAPKSKTKAPSKRRQLRRTVLRGVPEGAGADASAGLEGEAQPQAES